jgi:hypothetical protein
MTAVFGLLSTQAARIEARFGTRTPAVAGLLVATAGTALLALDTPHVTLARPLAGLSLVGLGLGLCWAQVTGYGLRAAPSSAAGQASGILFTARWLGGAIGIATLSAVYRSVTDDRLNDRLARLQLGLDHARRERIDALLSGSGSGKRVLAELPGRLHAPVLSAARDAAASGTGAALACVAGVTAIVGLLCLAFPREPVR